MNKNKLEENKGVGEVYDLLIKHVKEFLKEANLNHEEYTSLLFRLIG